MSVITEGEAAIALARSAHVRESQELAAARKVQAEAAAWPALESLPDSLQPVEPFDFEMLPIALQPWAMDIVRRVQCPADYIGAALVGALGVAVGRRVGVRPKRQDDWTEYGNQWVCIVGRPGQLKSPAMNAVLAPLRKLEADAAARFENDRALHEAESKIDRMRQDAAEKKAMATLKNNPSASVRLPEMQLREVPRLTRYIVNDTSMESLGETCRDNPQGVGVIRDELVSLLKSLDREGQEGSRGFYLTGWNGNEGYVVDRITRGRQRIEAVCLSLIGTTQPGRISEYIRDAVGGGAADDGLIQRFGILVFPDPPAGRWENVDCWPDAEAKAVAFGLFETLANANPVEAWDAEVSLRPDGEPNGEPPFLRFDDEAVELFVEWRVELENEVRSGDLHPALESHLSKYRKLVPSLALLFHLADDGRGPINADALMRALAYAHYLRSHAERAYGSVMLAEVDGAKALLKRIRSGDVQDGFTARDVYRKAWSRLENREAANRAIDVLVEHGYLMVEQQETGGRARRVYRIHPEIRT